jgi:uncharacterized lipoprotein YajG
MEITTKGNKMKIKNLILSAALLLLVAGCNKAGNDTGNTTGSTSDTTTPATSTNSMVGTNSSVSTNK